MHKQQQQQLRLAYLAGLHYQRHHLQNEARAGENLAYQSIPCDGIMVDNCGMPLS